MREPDDAPLGELIDHILVVHRLPLDAALPRLDALCRQVIAAHHAEDPARMEALRETWSTLLDALGLHLVEEERLLFPAIRAGRVVGAAADFEAEHVALRQILADVRRLLIGAAPERAGDPWRLLRRGVETLDRDLRRLFQIEEDELLARAARRRATHPWYGAPLEEPPSSA